MKLFVAVVMFVLGSSVFVGGQSPNPIPSPGKGSQPVQNSGAHENQKAGAPNAASKGPSFPHDRQYSAAVSKPDVYNPSGQPSQPSSDERIVWLTGVLAVAAVIQLLIYGRQSSYMREGLGVATRTAEATKEAAVIARETLRISQRAYLGTEDWEFRFGDAGIPIRIEFVLFNSGTTPAKMIGMAWQVHTRPTLPPPPDYSDVAVDPMKPLLIHPKRKITTAVNLADVLKGVDREKVIAYRPDAAAMDRAAMNSMILQEVIKGTLSLYLSGCLVYETVDLCLRQVFFLHYEAAPALRRFTIIGEQGYNYEIPYDKK